MLLDYIDNFKDKKILVIGDLYLDIYVVGTPSRISREAPVVVLEFVEQRQLPGGATSPACSVRALSGYAYQLGLVGDDQPGHDLTEVLVSRGVDVSGLVVDPTRPTITKTRILAEAPHLIPQQVARIDHVSRDEVSGRVQEQVLHCLQRLIAEADAVLFSDYKCGMVNTVVIEATLEAAKAKGKLVTVDSQGDLSKFRGCHLVKCNQTEAEAFFHRSLDTEEEFESALRELKETLEVQAVVITRGHDGISLLDYVGNYQRVPGYAQEVFDVTGAGDTVIAVLTMALVAGASVLEAAQLANFAALTVIRKLGNATVDLKELEQEVRKWNFS
jgi:rfaE bifunctional protein kinase chain/domain